MIAIVASMTTLIPIMGGYLLLLLRPYCSCSTSSTFIFPKEVEEVLTLGEKYSQGRDVNIKFFH